MREHKYRAWDKRQKQMSGIFTIADLTQYEHIFERMFNHLARFNDLIWLEYTGLKDKNGVEIYEGNIADYYGIKVIVKWDDESAMFYISTVKGKTHRGKWIPENEWAMPKVHNKRDKFEVIGNIYENKELLDKGGQ